MKKITLLFILMTCCLVAFSQDTLMVQQNFTKLAKKIEDVEDLKKILGLIGLGGLTLLGVLGYMIFKFNKWNYCLLGSYNRYHLAKRRNNP